MSEHSWVLEGVDPETLERAAAEADARGLSLADYLTEILLHTALVGQLSASEGEEGIELLEIREDRWPAPIGGSAGGALDAALHTLDSSFIGLAARVDHSDRLAAGAAGDVERARQELSAAVALLGKRVGDAEHGLGALGDAQDTIRTKLERRCETLTSRLDRTESIARDAESGVSSLSQAYDALKRAVADDFGDFDRDIGARLDAGLRDIRATADAAADQTERAARRFATDMREMRDALELRVNESAAETRARMQAAFADAAERFSSISERVTDNERQVGGAVDQLRAQIFDVEDSAQAALETATDALRQANSELSADLKRAEADARSTLECAQRDIAAEITALKAQHAQAAARLKALDAAGANVASDLTSLRETLDRRLSQAESNAAERLSKVQSGVSVRLDTLAALVDEGQERALEIERRLRADTERVEACTIAALEKIVQDISAGDAALERHVQAEIGEARDLCGVLSSRLKLVENTSGGQSDALSQIAERLSDVEGGERSKDLEFTERLSRLEAAALNTSTQDGLRTLRQDFETLAADVSASRADQSGARNLEALTARLAVFEGANAETADRVQGLARMIGRVSAQNADAAAQSQEGLHKLELMLADLRLDHLAKQNEPGPDLAQAAVAVLQQRVAELEDRQADALEALRADIARFMDQNDRRLAAIENQPVPAADYDIAAEFESLRQRLEARVVGVEHRSVRALEQVAETVSVIEKRFTAGDGRRSAQA